MNTFRGYVPTSPWRGLDEFGTPISVRGGGVFSAASCWRSDEDDTDFSTDSVVSIGIVVDGMFANDNSLNGREQVVLSGPDGEELIIVAFIESVVCVGKMGVASPMEASILERRSEWMM